MLIMCDVCRLTVCVLSPWNNNHIYSISKSQLTSASAPSSHPGLTHWGQRVLYPFNGWIHSFQKHFSFLRRRTSGRPFHTISKAALLDALSPLRKQRPCLTDNGPSPPGCLTERTFISSCGHGVNNLQWASSVVHKEGMHSVLHLWCTCMLQRAVAGADARFCSLTLKHCNVTFPTRP